MSKFCDREGVSVAAFHSRRQRLAPQQPEQVSRLAAPVFQAVDLLSQRAVVIRFAAGGVMEIPEDRVDLVSEPDDGLFGDDNVIPRSRESGLPETGVNPVAQRRDPESRLGVDRMTGNPGGDEQLDPDPRTLGSALRNLAEANRDPAVVGGEETDPPRRPTASSFSIERCDCVPSLRNRVIKPVRHFRTISAGKRLQTSLARPEGLGRIPGSEHQPAVGSRGFVVTKERVFLTNSFGRAWGDGVEAATRGLS